MKLEESSPSLAAEAYNVIRERIVRGEIAIGEVISRRKVAAELGMSFLPVSEAFLRLEFEGLLESRPRAGTRVRIPSREGVRGHYVVREGLEVQAARLFNEVATEAERAELLQAARRLDEMSSDMNVPRAKYLAAHEKLHRQIAEYSRCPALYEAIDRNSALSSIWFCVGGAPGASYSHRRHERLVEGLTKGTPEQAMEAMREHIASSRNRMLETLEPYFHMGEAQGQRYARGNKNRPMAGSAVVN
jgi:GntR family transcriptional regulator, rspAB operon transcriptional repressor